MAKPEWGVKRTCQSCDTFFYDLKKDPIICPKCLSVYDESALQANINHLKDSKDDYEKQILQDDFIDSEDDFYLDVQAELLESLDDIEDDLNKSESRS